MNLNPHLCVLSKKYGRILDLKMLKLFKEFDSKQNSDCHGNRKKQLKISSFRKQKELELKYLA
jgi:hypothetical protein